MSDSVLYWVDGGSQGETEKRIFANTVEETSSMADDKIDRTKVQAIVCCCSSVTEGYMYIYLKYGRLDDPSFGYDLFGCGRCGMASFLYCSASLVNDTNCTA